MEYLNTDKKVITDTIIQYAQSYTTPVIITLMNNYLLTLLMNIRGKTFPFSSTLKRNCAKQENNS